MSSDYGEEEDLPQLSQETYAALQEFYKEQAEREISCEVLKENSDQNVVFEENWQLSQFWYDDKTVDALIKVALKAVGISNGKIALISCPTLYKKLKQTVENQFEVTLFEYDQRFKIFEPDFIFYDYKSPLDIPRNLENHYDLVIADPPFLSEECLTKTAVTVKFLTKMKIIICTGVVMAELAEKLLSLKKCLFQPKHKNNLANEFSCFSNFDFDSIIETL